MKMIMSKADGRKVAKIIKANGSLTQKGLQAVWDLVNHYNDLLEKAKRHGQ